MKKVGKYLSIILLILTGLFFVCLLFLFFVPKSNLFGITFISYNEKTFTKFYDAETIDSVVINSRAYNIEVKSSTSSKLYAQIENHSLGYVLVDNSKLTVDEATNNKILTLTIAEPYGVAFKNNSSITLYVPKDKEINLSLSNKKATTKIDNTNLKLKNFSYSAQKGTLTVENASISGEINLNLGKTTAKISSKVILNNNNVNLKITTGKLDASNCILGNVKIVSNERGVILLNECHTLSQPNQTSGGRVEANSINNLSFYGSDTNLYIKEITNGADIILTSGDVEINSLTGASNIITESGNINIGSAFSSVTALTKSGEIVLSNAYYKVLATTTSGDIKVNFNSEAHFASGESKEYRYLQATSVSGNVTANGVNSAQVEITGSGNATINFESVTSNLGLTSDISTKKGNIFVSVKHQDAFILNSSTAGNSRINLMQTEKYNGWTDKEISNKSINGATLTNGNQINLTSVSGSILMHDDKVY